MKLNVVNLGKVAITVEEKPWNIHRSYDRLTIVEDNFTTYISRIPVPKDKPLTNRRYWVPFGTRSAVSVNAFTILSNISDLPTTFEDNNGPYLIRGVGYFWVGTSGDTLDGKYQSLQLTGPKGDTGEKGEKGDKGDQGESAYKAAMRVRASQGLPRLSLDDWITSLKGENGKDGKNGSPGQNGQDGKDGQDGAPGANGAPGKDGRDGYTPYIGDNGNWWINGVDTGKPSRGRDGASGEGGSGTSCYIQGNRLYIPINTGGNLPKIIQPLDGMVYSVTLTVPYVTILVLGSNITANTLLTVSNTEYFTLSKGDDTPSPSIVLTPEEVINGVEVKCTFISNNLNDSSRTHNTSIIITSANQEYSQKIVKVNYSLPNRPDVIPSGGLTPANPNS